MRGITLKKEKWVCLGILWVLVTALCFTFIREDVPPQMGWWDYYAWQMNEGKQIYKDLFLFVPPGYVWLMASLYKLFGNHILWYQYVGIVPLCLSSTFVYLLLCRMVRPCFSMAAVLVGTVISMLYPTFIALDHNPTLFCFILASIYLSVLGIEKKDTKFFVVSGGAFGFAILIKQSIPYLLAAIVIIMMIGALLKIVKLKDLVSKGAAFLLGNMIVVSVGIMKLQYNGVLPLFYSQIFEAVKSKGYSASSPLDIVSTIIVRYYDNGFSWVEFFIGLMLFVVLSRSLYGIQIAGRAKKILCYFLFNLILFKLMRIAIYFDMVFIGQYITAAFVLNGLCVLWEFFADHDAMKALTARAGHLFVAGYKHIFVYFASCVCVLFLCYYGFAWNHAIAQHKFLETFMLSVGHVSFYFCAIYVMSAQ